MSRRLDSEPGAALTSDRRVSDEPRDGCGVALPWGEL